MGAVVAVLADAGWAGVTVASVARAAGLSPRPVQDRFPDRWAMAVGAWQQQVGPALEGALLELLESAGLEDDRLPRDRPAGPVLQLRAALESALDAAGLRHLIVGQLPDDLDDPLLEMNLALESALDAAGRADLMSLRAAGPSADWLANALGAFLRPGAELRAAAELLVVSAFNDDLAETVGSEVAHRVAAWCHPTGEHPEAAVSRAYLISIALGLLLSRTRQGAADLDLRDEARHLLDAFKNQSKPAVLPATRAEHLDDFLGFDTGDASLDALLRGTMEEVGRVGYEGATTAAIGRASGRSEGLVFARYPSKVELFVDATRRQHARNWRANEVFHQGIAAVHGPGIAEAVVIREFQRPDLRGYRAISLEQVRMALHDERLREVQWGELELLVAQALAEDPNWAAAGTPAHLHLSVAIGLGVTVLPILAPEAWLLPYDVVTVPLDEG